MLPKEKTCRKLNRRSKNEYTVDLSKYRSHFRYPRPHPLKEEMDACNVSVEEVYAILEGWPDRPSLHTLGRMLEGEEWLPFALEVIMWRKLHYCGCFSVWPKLIQTG